MSASVVHIATWHSSVNNLGTAGQKRFCLTLILHVFAPICLGQSRASPEQGRESTGRVRADDLFGADSPTISRKYELCLSTNTFAVTALTNLAKS
jgi:hypothetical protein